MVASGKTGQPCRHVAAGCRDRGALPERIFAEDHADALSGPAQLFGRRAAGGRWLSQFFPASTFDRSYNSLIGANVSEMQRRNHGVQRSWGPRHAAFRILKAIV
ncbi:hypothetical protein CBM2633_A100019 [Cupriavidus taiwanensis]|uniref:Uncharacterized protein n=1 Tax=Cupriavidus taiwanensis TaxID=164546 RepID=A0A375E482_9BURK|nr:hypothetical protein CBM2615_A280017 [Cupriavidus taiwanensis]SOZ56909.1 hypothetical protein CBM2614_A250018 [Cupriavidus taiwanensis]SOZ59032.1 hypothetical protein CBM2613_A250017 [Cupriavidus taiwanensis]SPA05493.1 hypothetical protein CBM2625_A200018 [Cupriavidus taiwanensis]SPA11755.1 hypothetical protein CBM2633_A100019 [Cupriavidus taiwanensis]